MRLNHELDRGVICEKCEQVVYKGNYKRINTLDPLVEDTTGRCKNIHRLNLCNKCYTEYKDLLNRHFFRNKVL